MDDVTACNVKGVTRSGEERKNYHLTQLCGALLASSSSFVLVFTACNFNVLVQSHSSH